jgi:hypothetical protein
VRHFLQAAKFPASCKHSVSAGMQHLLQQCWGAVWRPFVLLLPAATCRACRSAFSVIMRCAAHMAAANDDDAHDDVSCCMYRC